MLHAGRAIWRNTIEQVAQDPASGESAGSRESNPQQRQDHRLFALFIGPIEPSLIYLLLVR
jgi:hypothetical protein